MSASHEPSAVALSPARRGSIRDLVALIKVRQTVLLLTTGVSAYALSLGNGIRWGELGLAVAALTAAIAGCTALNMVFDRDIDAAMSRTTDRPLPAGRLSPLVATAFGLALLLSGLAVAWFLSPLFGVIVTLGFVFDFGVYTAWLKRRTPFSILWGGISGGMPALAGRTLALGHVDVVGILLALAVLLWIPAHILTLSSRHAAEYSEAGVPVLPNTHGLRTTVRVIAAATVLNVATLFLAGHLLHVGSGALAGLGIAGAALIALAVLSLAKPSDANSWRLFKFASIYMVVSFALLSIGAVMR